MSFSRADLSGADLSYARMWHTGLRDAVLIGADLAGAEVEVLDLRGAIFDETTIWPPGFKLSRHKR